MTLRLFRVSWSSGIALALTLTLAAIASYSLTQARWTANPDAHVLAVWLGLLCGALLSLTRWRGRTALAYSLSLSVIAAFETLARVAFTPALTTDMLRGLHVRLLTGAERVGSWAATLAAGESVSDIGLFIALMNILAWSVMAWLAWWLARRQQPLVAVLPLAALLALNNHLSRQPSAGFIAVLACVLLLLASAGAGQLWREWDARRVDYSDQLAAEWGASAVTLTLIIGLAVAGAPLAATPEGWRAVAQWFEGPAAQTAAQLFSGVNPPRDLRIAPFAQTPDLSRIGLPIPQSDEVVMWVQISDPPPLPPVGGEASAAAPPTHYWRNAIFGAYTGQGWRANDEVIRLSEAQGASPESIGAAGRYPLQQRFEIVAEHGPALFAVNQPVTASVTINMDGLVQGEVASYTVTSLATRVTATELVAASKVYAEEITSRYLQLPQALPARVIGLAQRLAADAPTPYDKAVRVQNYLRANYSYRLDAPLTPSGRDAVDYFLFEGPGGFCSHYASAMVVLLRAVDVPARVVAGFAMGSYDFERGAWRVPASASHAWVEVYFPEYGWVEFEPTAAFSPREYPGDIDSTSAPNPQSEIQNAQPLDGWGAARLAGYAALLIAALVWLLRPLFIPTPPAAEQVRALYWHMRLRLSRAGLTATASTTPEEFLRAHAAALAPPLRAALAEATRVYERAEYGESSPSSHEVEDVQHQWQRARGEWIRLWFTARVADKIRACVSIR